MDYTYLEIMIWNIVSKINLEYVLQGKPHLNPKEFRRKVKQKYKEIIEKTPYTDSFRKNKMRGILVVGMLWLAIYESLEGEMSEEEFGGMLLNFIEAPLVKKRLEGSAPYTEKYFGNMKKLAEQASKSESPFNWDIEFIPGEDFKEFRINFLACGLYELGIQEDCVHLVKYMCELDFKMANARGGELFRTKTISHGDGICDFHCIKKEKDLEKSKS